MGAALLGTTQALQGWGPWFPPVLTGRFALMLSPEPQDPMSWWLPEDTVKTQLEERCFGPFAPQLLICRIFPFLGLREKRGSESKRGEFFHSTSGLIDNNQKPPQASRVSLYFFRSLFPSMSCPGCPQLTVFEQDPEWPSLPSFAQGHS